MTTTSCKLVFAASLVAVYTLASLPIVAQSKGNPGPSNLQSVLVINSPGAPVPTAAQGTTNVAGTVNLSSGSTVNIGNTPNVNVANTPSVNVANTPTVSLAGGTSVGVTNPLDGQNNPMPLATLDAIQPYQDGCLMFFTGGSQGSCQFHQIPAGKRLVIQVFDAEGELETGVKPVQLHLQLPGLFHVFTATFMGTNTGVDYFATHQETRLYADSTGTQLCVANISAASNNSRYGCSLSGFLVDVP